MINIPEKHKIIPAIAVSGWKYLKAGLKFGVFDTDKPRQAQFTIMSVNKKNIVTKGAIRSKLPMLRIVCIRIHDNPIATPCFVIWEENTSPILKSFPRESRICTAVAIFPTAEEKDTHIKPNDRNKGIMETSSRTATFVRSTVFGIVYAMKNNRV
jgi:hypothetical protein